MVLGSGIRKKPIPDPGSRGQKGTGSRIRIRNTEIHCLLSEDTGNQLFFPLLLLLLDLKLSFCVFSRKFYQGMKIEKLFCLYGTVGTLVIYL